MANRLPTPLSLEEKDDLAELSRSDTFRALLRHLDVMLFDASLKFSRERVDAERLSHTALQKARLEGKEEFVNDLKLFIQSLRS